MDNLNTSSKAFERLCGVLLHPTSLPSPYGIGDFGQGAFDFIDFLSASSQHLWQCLPLGPTGFGDSPYQLFSSFAGQPLLISPQKLQELELLEASDFDTNQPFDPCQIDYEAVINYKHHLFKKAYLRFNDSFDPILHQEFNQFCQKEHDWLDDYCLFMTLKDLHQGASWLEWEEPYKFLKEDLKAKLLLHYQHDLNYYRFLQFIFFKQWQELKNYAKQQSIEIIGDIPIFVALDSADVWAHKELFQLNHNGIPTFIAGVPPDYFSETGQLWGNPLYQWSEHQKTHFDWWIKRIKHQLSLVDYLRIDHFRGFESYWAIPYGDTTAINGQWRSAPGQAFFDTMFKVLGKDLPIWAEDLGIITPAVENLRDHFNFPGMKVLQFAFDNVETNPLMPFYHPYYCICYTGTHDNDTTKGWYLQASEQVQDKVRRYMNCDGNSVHWDFIRIALSSPAKYTIYPLQDILGLDSNHRLNTPGTAMNNWTWRYQSHELNDDLASYLSSLTILYGRERSSL